MERDEALLGRYARDHSEEAFTELVRRHCDLVWCAARRVLGDPELARDAAQCVFADLSRKAGALPPNVVLAGWLYRAACLAASKIARREIRRAQREHNAMESQELSRSEGWEAKAAAELQILLDAALAELNESDRDAVVLRFLCDRSLAEVGAALGSNEDAAQKKVARALEKLRGSFRRRGVEVTSGVASAALSLAGSQAAPAGAAGILAVGALTASSSIPVFALFALMKTKLIVGLAAGIAMAGGLVIQHQKVARLQSENENLQRQLAPPTAPAAQTTPVRDSADNDQLERARQEHDELLRLRGEYALLLNRPPPASPELARLKGQLDEARKGLIAQRAEAQKQIEKAYEGAAAMSASRDVIESLKQIGLACRLHANDHNSVLPRAFGEINPAELPPKMPGNITLDMFEFVNYDHPLTTSGSGETILMRERVPRRMSNGHFMRCHLNADGSASTLTSDDGNFDAMPGNALGSGTPPVTP